jgi:hypothetical protein
MQAACDEHKPVSKASGHHGHLVISQPSDQTVHLRTNASHQLVDAAVGHALQAELFLKTKKTNKIINYEVLIKCFYESQHNIATVDQTRKQGNTTLISKNAVITNFRPLPSMFTNHRIVLRTAKLHLMQSTETARELHHRQPNHQWWTLKPNGHCPDSSSGRASAS